MVVLLVLVADSAAPANNLILDFDCVLPHDFDGLVTQRVKILEGLGVSIRHRLFKGVKLGDTHILGRRTNERNYLSVGGTQIATAGRLLRGPDSLREGLVRVGISY